VGLPGPNRVLGVVLISGADDLDPTGWLASLPSVPEELVAVSVAAPP
jgi:hypothetical protein